MKEFIKAAAIRALRTLAQTAVATICTIVQVKSGKGPAAGWGWLKSGAGWISIDYAKRI